METYSGKWYSTKYTAAFSRGNVWVDLPVEQKDEEIIESPNDNLIP